MAATTRKMKLIAATIIFWLARTAFSHLDILSFNVKQFGKTKMSKQDTVDILIKVYLLRVVLLRGHYTLCDKLHARIDNTVYSPKNTYIICRN